MAMGISRLMSNKERGCLEFRGKVEDDEAKEEEGEEIFSIPFSEVEDWPHEREFGTIMGGWLFLFLLV